MNKKEEEEEEFVPILYIYSFLGLRKEDHCYSVV
jgi:hypothetical protein